MSLYPRFMVRLVTLKKSSLSRREPGILAVLTLAILSSLFAPRPALADSMQIRPTAFPLVGWGYSLRLVRLWLIAAAMMLVTAGGATASPIVPTELSAAGFDEIKPSVDVFDFDVWQLFPNGIGRNFITLPRALPGIDGEVTLENPEDVWEVTFTNRTDHDWYDFHVALISDNRHGHGAVTGCADPVLGHVPGSHGLQVIGAGVVSRSSDPTEPFQGDTFTAVSDDCLQVVISTTTNPVPVGNSFTLSLDLKTPSRLVGEYYLTVQPSRDAATVPEPSSLVLCSTGVAILLRALKCRARAGRVSVFERTRVL